jgi:excisionase family DNA binding protein
MSAALRRPCVDTDIMTLEEVARYLRLKPQTIYTWAQEKKIPAAKLGKEWRFRKSIIDAWFEQHIDEKFQGAIEESQKKPKGSD